MSMNSDWAGLPSELVDLILQRLTSVSDYFRFGATCTAWHDVVTENINYLLSQKHPMLIVPLNTQDVWSLYSIKDNKLLPLPFQVPYVDRFVGSSNGWLVTVDDDLVVRLLNPLCLVLGKQIDHDPNIHITLPPLDPPCCVFNQIRKVVLSANPTSSPNDYMIMAIFSADHHVAYIKPNRDKEWTYVNHNWGVLHDLIYYRDRYYAIDYKGEIIYFNVADRLFFKYLSINHNVDLENFEMKYLVESPIGELLLVERIKMWHWHGDVGYNNTEGAKVWNLKLASGGWEWREVKNIGDYALFVGDNNSLSVVASDFCGCQSNCIYFIDDYENFLFPSMVLENSYALKNTKDVGVYNMETRSFTSYDIAKDDVWLADTTKLGIVPSSVVYKPV
ncbi:putative F-box protein At3g25750 [Gossypium arboreum]|uniref:putative F-box protein At3g25750 n=1 Tax=Gossypium arboreum TaxID=29729 RepID=UPI000819076C|nr:putative F-box protein At3g25750 [Gossypium arboreum]